jgi:methylmalonyl-CoA mutase N-terminal domain/subunit
MPRWVPLAMSGYHIRESGSDAVQEVAWTFANARAYLDEAVSRGVSVDEVAPTLFTFLSVTMDFLPAVARLRAARRVWAQLMRDTYGASDPRRQQLRIFAFTAGSTFTAQQPLNNVARASIEATAAALAGVQTLHVSAYDEAVGVPTEAAATLALRTQQVVAHETGLTTTVDPLAGSYAVEALTDDLEQRIVAEIEAVQAQGGSLACIESGWYADRLAESAYQYARSVDDGERVVVGVNRWASPPEPLEVFAADPDGEARQVAAVLQVREQRDDSVWRTAMDRLRADAASGVNVLPACVEAVRAYATVGEICGVLRDVHGAWQPTQAF